MTTAISSIRVTGRGVVIDLVQTCPVTNSAEI
jgi:hypothetical protein